MGRPTCSPVTSATLRAWAARSAVKMRLEEVMLARDENANMVWGIEQTVRMPTGEPRSGARPSPSAAGCTRPRWPTTRARRWRTG